MLSKRVSLFVKFEISNISNSQNLTVYSIYIEPLKEEKVKIPVVDKWIDLLKYAFAHSKKGCCDYSKLIFHEDCYYRGMHETDCGETSRNYDYLFENGIITNSLAKFYLIWYRNSIPDSEFSKLLELKKFYSYDFDLILSDAKKIDLNTRFDEKNAELIINENGFLIKCKDVFGTRFTIDIKLNENINDQVKVYFINSREIKDKKLIHRIDEILKDIKSQ